MDLQKIQETINTICDEHDEEEEMTATIKAILVACKTLFKGLDVDDLEEAENVSSLISIGLEKCYKLLEMQDFHRETFDTLTLETKKQE